MQTVGRITKLFGVDGGVSAVLYPAFPEDFRTTEPLLSRSTSWRFRFFVPHSSVADRRAPYSASTISIRRAAPRSCWAESCCCPSARRAADDEFYMEDLIGFEVRAGELTGELTDYFDSEANPLFELTLDGREYLVPAVEEFIAGIDFERRTITFVLPEGLLEL